MRNFKFIYTAALQLFKDRFYKKSESFPKINFHNHLEVKYKQEKSFNFIQIGAHDGIKHDNLYQFISARTTVKGIVVEPIVDYFNLLNENYKGFPGVKKLNFCIHPKDETVTLYRVDPKKEADLPDWAPGIASLNPHHHLKTFIASESIIPEECKAITFMDMYYRYSHFDELIDLIQIDVEGFDYEVLKMINFKELKPSIIKYEHINLTRSDFIRSYILLEKNNYRVFNEGGDLIGIKR